MATRRLLWLLGLDALKFSLLAAAVASVLWVVSTDSLPGMFNHQVQSVNVVLGPAVPVGTDGKSGWASGTDACPTQDLSLVRQARAYLGGADTQTCIVVTPETRDVRVNVTFDDHTTVEHLWVVERHDSKVYFRRDDGKPVIVLHPGAFPSTERRH